MDIFISYKREDEEIALKIYDTLIEAGYEVWIDKYNIPFGSYWPEEIDKGLRGTTITIGLLSEKAVASRNVLNEWNWTLDAEKPLILLNVQQFPREKMPHRFISINYLDFRQLTLAAFNLLKNTIESILSSSGTYNLFIDDIPRTLHHTVAEAPYQTDRSNQTADANFASIPIPEQHPQNILEKHAPTHKPQGDIPERDRIIEIVERDWIEGHLKQSLQYGVLNIGLESAKEYVLRNTDYGDYSFTGSENIADLFSDVHGQLLILGKPGSGKTTLMLQIAEKLLSQARQDLSASIPVIFNLTSWAEVWKNPEEFKDISFKSMKQIVEWLKNEINANLNHKTIEEWIIDELQTTYELDLATAHSWLNLGLFTFFFDGLDEVNDEYRNECVSFLNEFKNKHREVDILVCSRIGEYEELTEKLQFSNALMLQDIPEQDVRNYLEHNARPEILMLIESGDALGAIMRTPFWISFGSYVYTQMAANVDLGITNSLDYRKSHIFATFTESCLSQLTSDTDTREDINRYVGWLAYTSKLLGITFIKPDQINTRWFPPALREILTMTNWFSTGIALSSVALTPILGLIGVGIVGMSGQKITIMRPRIVRFFLHLVHLAPLDFVKFLDELADVGILHKSNNGYIFIHNNLRDYLSTFFDEEKYQSASGKTLDSLIKRFNDSPDGEDQLNDFSTRLTKIRSRWRKK